MHSYIFLLTNYPSFPYLNKKSIIPIEIQSIIIKIEDVHVNANLRWSCEKQKHIQIIIQNYNDNLHEHQNQTKYYHYSLNTTWNQAK